MLVLSRYLDQKIDIVVEGKIVCTVQVVDVIGDKVRLGFDADSDVIIARRELIMRERRNGESNKMD